MSEKSKEMLKLISQDEKLGQQLSDLYEKDPDGFTENWTQLLQEKGIDVSSEDFDVNQDLSLEELDQIAGGRNVFIDLILKYGCGRAMLGC